MRLLYDRRLLRPLRLDVIQALVDATAAINEQADLLAFERSHWEREVPRIRDKPEGRLEWAVQGLSARARVVLVWWTDHRAERHLRVCGELSAFGPFPTLGEGDERAPPLWSLYPERLFRHHSGPRGWVAACVCGESGPPASLGWMGTRCAVCHDRAQDGEVAPHDPIAHLLSHNAGSPLAFSDDGQLLATVLSPGNSVRIHDLTTGQQHDLPSYRRPLTALAFSSDGRFLASVERVSPEENAVVRIHDWQDNLVVHAQDAFPGTCGLLFAPDDLALAVWGPEGLFLLRQDEAGWRMTRQSPVGGTALAFSPDGKQLAYGGEGWATLIDLASSAEPALPFPQDLTVWDLHFSADGRALRVLQSDGTVPPDTTILATIDLSEFPPRSRAEHQAPELARARLSPGGRWTAGPVAGTSRIWVAETAPFQVIGELGWAPDDVPASVAFSPDERTLAVSYASGPLKLVPWYDLLMSSSLRR